MQATQQTCSLDVESASLGATALSLSLSLRERPRTSSAMRTQGWAKGRRRTDWQPAFDFIVTTEEDDMRLRPCPLYYSYILPEEGCDIRDAVTGHLGRLPMFKTSVPD